LPGNYQWVETEEGPTGPGWVRIVDGWEDFPSVIQKMFSVIFSSITNKVEIIHSTTDDPNTSNNQVTFIITPVSST
jgi:hypothetical protein